MSWTSSHTKWLIDTGQILKTSDKKRVEVWEFCYERDDSETMSKWAKHFRNHYCLDSDIDTLRNGTPHDRAAYLNQIKFPDHSRPGGSSIRAGDFGEILIADFLEFILDFWVPRTRYRDKTIRNESVKGCDTIGFKFVDDTEDNPNDTLVVFEVKTRFSSTANALQDAVDHSIKDQARRGESLNAIKQRLLSNGQRDDVRRIGRFQNPVDKPYFEISGAAALFSTPYFDKNLIPSVSTKDHPSSDNLMLIVIHGDEMMNLIHHLYERAANEA